MNYLIAAVISAALSAFLGTVVYNEMMAHLDVGRSAIVPITFVVVFSSFLFQMAGAVIMFRETEVR